MQADHAAIAARIRSKLHALGLTEDQLARLLGESPWWLSRRMTGGVDWRLGDIHHVARALGVSDAWLLGHDEEKDSK